MSTFTQIYFHVVFSTFDRRPVLTESHHEKLFRYIWGLLEKRECTLCRINARPDHVHMLFALHPSQPLAEVVKQINAATTRWIRSEIIFPKFDKWQSGYGAFTVGHEQKDAVTNYIANQAEHHRKLSFHDELRNLLDAMGVEYNDKYLL